MASLGKYSHCQVLGAAFRAVLAANLANIVLDGAATFRRLSFGQFVKFRQILEFLVDFIFFSKSCSFFVLVSASFVRQ